MLHNFNHLFYFRSVESADEIMSKIMDDEGKSELILQKIVAFKKNFFVCPTFRNFFPPLEELDLEQDWENGLKVPAARFFCMVRLPRVEFFISNYSQSSL